MTLAYSEKYTIEDYRMWEGDWELIRGEAFSMSPSPNYIHQRISGKIFRQLDEKLENCKHCHAVFETDIEFAEDIVVRPDCMVICYEPGDRLARAPELVFEVISKSSAKRDEILKFDLYQSEAVKYYVIVYPEHRKAKLYQLVDFKYQKQGDFTDEHFNFELSQCAFNFDFGYIWRNKAG